jgi:hypothetical protein
MDGLKNPKCQHIPNDPSFFQLKRDAVSRKSGTKQERSVGRRSYGHVELPGDPTTNGKNRHQK